MIYVTLGTQSCDFSRCLKMLEELIEEYGIDEEIVAQIGFTKFHTDKFKCFDFVPEDKYQEYMSQARVVISHAGTGALFSSIKKGKKVIAVARLAKYKEMVKDHQTEIVRKLAGEGYILDGTNSIVAAWKLLDNFTPRPCDFECTLPQEIGKLIDGWLK